MVSPAHLTAAVVVIVFTTLSSRLSLFVITDAAEGSGNGESTAAATSSPPPPGRSTDPNLCGHGSTSKFCPPSPTRDTSQRPDPPPPPPPPPPPAAAVKDTPLFWIPRSPPVNHPSYSGLPTGQRNHMPSPPPGADSIRQGKGRSLPPPLLPPPPPPPPVESRPVKPPSAQRSAAKQAKRDVGWAFLGVAILLQVVLGSYLAYKRRTLEKKVGVRAEKTPTSPPALRPASATPT